MSSAGHYALDQEVMGSNPAMANFLLDQESTLYSKYFFLETGYWKVNFISEAMILSYLSIGIDCKWFVLDSSVVFTDISD